MRSTRVGHNEVQVFDTSFRITQGIQIICCYMICPGKPFIPWHFSHQVVKYILHEKQEFISNQFARKKIQSERTPLTTTMSKHPPHLLNLAELALYFFYAFYQKVCNQITPLQVQQDQKNQPGPELSILKFVFFSQNQKIPFIAVAVCTTNLGGSVGGMLAGLVEERVGHDLFCRVGPSSAPGSSTTKHLPSPHVMRTMEDRRPRRNLRGSQFIHHFLCFRVVFLCFVKLLFMAVNHLQVQRTNINLPSMQQASHGPDHRAT
jgi:hypothetical protein